MALSPCNTATDPTGRELVKHGSVPFPIACYHDDLTRAEVPWHWHEEWEAAIITEGSALVCAGQEKRIIRAGEGFFINSGVLHGAWNAGSGSCRFHSLVFHPRLVGGSLDSVFYQSYCYPLLENPAGKWLLLTSQTVWQREILDDIESAWQEVRGEKPGYEFHVRACLSQVVFSLGRHLPEPRQETNGKALRDGERMKTMLSFIHNHYPEALTMESIAASAALSESECLRCFRNTIGTTPIQYVKQYRIQQAARLLLSTQDNISDVAAACGFQDASYFTKTFRELKGRTPSRYREESKA